MDTIGNNSQAQIKEFVSQITEAEAQIEAAKEKYIAPLRSNIKDIYSAAASDGFDKKALKEVVRKSKMAEELRWNIDQYENAALQGILE